MKFRRVASSVLSVISLLGATALADDVSRVAVRLDGLDAGQVRVTHAGDGASRTISIATTEPAPAVLALVRSFMDGRGPKRNALLLSTGAVVQKTTEARLAGVRFPSFAGGSGELSLTFDAPQLSTSPLLRVANDRAPATGQKLSSFRIAIGDLPATEATRLDGLVMKTKDGALVPRETTFDVPSKDAPPFLAWQKKPKPIEASIEYVGPLGEVVFGVKLTTCAPSSVKIDGPVTHVVMGCARART